MWRDTSLPPELQKAAGKAAAELQQSEPSRIPAILERLRGSASVAATGFATVRPILDALGSMMS